MSGSRSDEPIQLRRLFRIVNGGTPTSAGENWNGGVVWVTPEDLGSNLGRGISSSRRMLTYAGLRSAASLVSEGSVVLSTRAPVGHLAVTGVALAFNQGCKALVPIRELDERFFYYQLLARRGELQASSRGSTFVELSAEGLGSFPLLAPSLGEQRRIADFLDEETRHVDDLIEHKQRLGELLTERRQSATFATIIGPSVVGSSDLRAESPAPWLRFSEDRGSVRPLRSLIRCLDGARVPLNAEQRAEMRGPYPYWGANGVVDYLNEYLFDEDLVLLGEDGAPFDHPLKDVAFVVREPVWVNNHIHVLRPSGIDADYLALYLNCVDLTLFASGSTRLKLTQGSMGRIPVLARPLRAQRELVSEAEALREGLELGLQHLRSEVALIQERRRAIITAAVTGELDPSSYRRPREFEAA